MSMEEIAELFFRIERLEESLSILEQLHKESKNPENEKLRDGYNKYLKRKADPSHLPSFEQWIMCQRKKLKH
jgi:hypothetical protein